VDGPALSGVKYFPSLLPHRKHLESLPEIHKDPFDRLLICQAVTEELTLVTCDEEIQKYSLNTIW